MHHALAGSQVSKELVGRWPVELFLQWSSQVKVDFIYGQSIGNVIQAWQLKENHREVL